MEPIIETCNIDPLLIIKAINKKNKAIELTHLYGKMCDMPAISKIAKEYDLKVIENCAQSHGAIHSGIKAGNWSDAGAFSFYPTKNLGCVGDGGAITTNDDELAEKLYYFRNYGSKIKYRNKYIGFNSRLDELRAAFLRKKLQNLNDINKHKQELSKIYFEQLDAKFIKPILESNNTDVFYIFNIRHNKEI